MARISFNASHIAVAKFLVLLLGAVLFGYWKGLAWQIASVAAIVVSYFAAYRFRDQVAQYVQAEYPFNRIAAMLIIFVACSLIIWLAYAYVNRSLEKAELDGFNRQMGALVGAFLGILLCMVVTMFSVSLLGQPAHDSIHYSKFGPYVLRGISMVRSVVPEELSASLDPHFDRFYQQTGYTPDRPINSFPAYQNPGANPNPVPGGSQYTFNPSSGQSFQGNWGYQPNTQGYQPHQWLSAELQSNSNSSSFWLSTERQQSRHHLPSTDSATSTSAAVTRL